MLREAGGVAVRARRARLRDVAAELVARVDAHRVLSYLPELLASTAVAPPDDPHALADVDLALFRADFGVAENGAVWVSDEVAVPRAAFFLPEHVAVLLDVADLVPDMHAAYARLGAPLPSFGCFVAGPSKTADIEQALVIGAHGPRSLTLVLVESD
jgi:L-lactate dehydrogenase complex protein LldG